MIFRCKTGPLSKQQTHEYEYMKTAGADGESVFRVQAVNAVYLYSLGDRVCFAEILQNGFRVVDIGVDDLSRGEQEALDLLLRNSGV